jgi:hypothetical protein
MMADRKRYKKIMLEAKRELEEINKEINKRALDN